MEGRRPVRPGQVLSVDVAALADGPDALCLVDGYVVFVPLALPGERVRVRIESAGRKHGRGTLLAVERPSPDRVPARCVHFGECGGCDFQGQSVAAQRAAKRARVAKALAHALKRPAESLPVAPVEGPPDPWAQRTKVALVLSPDVDTHVRAGLFARRSRHVVSLRECPVSEPEALRVALAVVEAVRRQRAPVAFPPLGEPGLRAVVARAANGTRETHVTLVGTDPPSAVPGLEALAAAARAAGAAGVSYNVNPEAGPALLGRETHLLHGPTRIREQVEGRTYLVSPGAFFQTSAWGVAHLVRAVRARVPAPPPETPRPRRDIVDLYCGGGLLALALADRARRVVGVEGNPHAIEDARASARAADIRNAEFIVGRVEDKARALARTLDAETVLLDPPRDGCAPGALAAVCEALRPRRLLYVSCDPDSLARDAATLEAGGYALREAAPFDMFPHTHHIETLAVFEPARAAPLSRGA